MRDRVTNILAVLDVASEPSDMDLPGYDLHHLIGKLKEFWSVKVTGSWRVIFRFEDANARDIDLIDYH
jgi:proteic killer suppression protein